MPYYTYAFARNGNGLGQRYLIITDRQETADFIYRGLSQNEDPHFTGLERVSPQMWLWNRGRIQDLVRDINRGGVFPVVSSLHQAKGKVLVQVLPKADNGAAFPILPNNDSVDYIGGRTFFIRNKMNPQLFWYYGEDNNFITASTRYRSGFLIQPSSGPGTVMVDADRVELYVYGSQTQQRIGNGQNFLSTVDNNFTFPFGALKFRFFVTAAGTIAAGGGGGGVAAPAGDRITWSGNSSSDNPADIWEVYR
ncbi:hypothetical protein CNMCM5623_006924 [Aspergillus felis]|uniref:Uncharacterized protein n=1 Tax=Aspergillus felis TaxID=1287682 RepID=A0A8H6V0Q9_9EURO|nr:hypothetical protein CNMCM5623_006924 [Aspergillus felis]